MCVLQRERERQRDPETDGALASLSGQAWRRRPKVENQSALCLPPQGWRLFNTGTANRLVKSTCGSHEASQSSSVHTLARCSDRPKWSWFTIQHLFLSTIDTSSSPDQCGCDTVATKYLLKRELFKETLSTTTTTSMGLSSDQSVKIIGDSFLFQWK